MTAVVISSVFSPTEVQVNIPCLVYFVCVCVCAHVAKGELFLFLYEVLQPQRTSSVIILLSWQTALQLTCTQA